MSCWLEHQRFRVHISPAVAQEATAQVNGCEEIFQGGMAGRMEWRSILNRNGIHLQYIQMKIIYFLKKLLWSLYQIIIFFFSFLTNVYEYVRRIEFIVLLAFQCFLTPPLLSLSHLYFVLFFVFFYFFYFIEENSHF